MKLIQTRIVTEDVPILIRFYEELTGVAPEGSEEYVEFQTAIGGLAICSKRSADMFNGGVALPASNRSLILDFEVEDVDKERIRIQKFVKEIIVEPTNQPWGNRSMIFRDPDGNLINFFTVISEKRGDCGCGKD